MEPLQKIVMIFLMYTLKMFYLKVQQLLQLRRQGDLSMVGRHGKMRKEILLTKI